MATGARLPVLCLAELKNIIWVAKLLVKVFFSKFMNAPIDGA